MRFSRYNGLQVKARPGFPVPGPHPVSPRPAGLLQVAAGMMLLPDEAPGRVLSLNRHRG